MRIIKSFFFSGDKFQPVYFWITLLMILIITAFIMRLCGIVYIDNALLLGLCGFVSAWVVMYNINRKNDKTAQLKAMSDD